jgi:hypothetical protein
MLFGLVTTVCVEGKGARSTLGARSWKQRSMQIRLAKLCRVVSLTRGQATRRSTGQDCRDATNMILAGRWPPVQLASDAQCYRERINRERAHRRPERPQTTATAVPLPYNVPNPMYSWKPLTRTQKVLVPLSPRGAEPRSFGRVDGAQVPPRSELLVPTMVPTTSVPFTQFSTKPFRVEYSTLPQRTPEHLDACSEMTQMSWFEPPLVMSRNYCEPRNVFNSYVEHSTASVARPAAIWPARAP